ncbi:hypothetical protein LCGC14_2117930 [marine sediment metagenome]|uniref:Uncharacterized protein n=1 Tax=marine sediment metagenome TaxID=412755 RepID=A0A0F9GI72_9ZZZZ
MIKNGHGQRATARVWIDGAQVSQLGDFVVPANGGIDLERFLDRSLTEGKRFKFVSLDHPDVDDPGRSENGEIRVEFRLEKQVKPEDYLLIPHDQWQFQYNRVPMRFEGTIDIPVSGAMDANDSTISAGEVSNDSVLVSNSSSTLPGATVQGSDSDQQFTKIHFEIGEAVTTLELRMVGINPSLSMNYLW